MSAQPKGAVILLVGCGKMGSALLAGWLASDQVAHVYIVEPHNVVPIDPARVTMMGTIAELPNRVTPDMIVLAVKPQVMGDVAPAYRRLVDRGSAALTIAVGKPISAYEQWLGGQAAILRAMPNTPAAIGRGITAVVANANVQSSQRALAATLLSSVGEIVWLDDEKLIDAVSAVSGSGPAYVFLLIEVMAAAGVKAGLPADLSLKLARATVSGAGELARLSGEPVDQLRRNVTSPNGTTAAALGVLMGADGIGALFDQAIEAAIARAKELAAP